MTAIKRFFQIKESGILLALIVMCVGLSVMTTTFLTQYNIGVVIRQASFVAIVALGETLVLLIGGIDLSVGYIAGLSSILGCLLMTSTNIDPYICTLIALGTGLIFGSISGLFIARMKLNPFIVTLAMGEVFAGLILVITKGYAVLNLPKKFTILGQGMVGPVPIPVIIMLILAVIMAYILRSTPFGRNIYAIGGNQFAARLVGIPVEKIKVGVYAISGMLAALAGMLFASRVNAGQPTAGAAWLMPIITAAIIGGTSLSGGEGTILGTILGAVFMGILANGIVLLDISAYWERVIIGAVVLVAVIIDMLRSRKKQ
ncbi:MAG: ABC transporter permease [Nitrospinales bacterium]